MKNNNTKNNSFNRSRTIDRMGRKALEANLPRTIIYISELEASDTTDNTKSINIF